MTQWTQWIRPRRAPRSFATSQTLPSSYYIPISYCDCPPLAQDGESSPHPETGGGKAISPARCFEGRCPRRHGWWSSRSSPLRRPEFARKTKCWRLGCLHSDRRYYRLAQYEYELTWFSFDRCWLLTRVFAAALTTVYSFSKVAAANLREKDDTYNTAIASFLGGAALGLRSMMIHHQ